MIEIVFLYLLFQEQSCTRAEIRNAGPPRGPHFYHTPARCPQEPAQIFSSLLKRNCLYICKRLKYLELKISLERCEYSLKYAEVQDVSRYYEEIVNWN